MYCRETGLPFSEEMLTWEPKVFPQWKQYPQYHLWFESVTHSSGFIKQDTEKASKPKVELQPGLQAAVERALPFYDKLYGVRCIPVHHN